MSKKILVFAVLCSLVLSMTVTQEANALTKSAGQYSHTTASLDPSRVCGNHICQPGESSKWSLAVLASQRQGPGKATGAQHGIIIMHQMVVNSLVKMNHTDSIMITLNKTNSMKSQDNSKITAEHKSTKSIGPK